MARGRPNTAEPLFRAYMRQKSDPIFDLKLDSEPFKAFARDQQTTAPEMRHLLHRLSKKGVAHPLQWGRYLIQERPTKTPQMDALDPLADALLRRLDTDYYLSWHSALWHHGLIDQQSRKIFVAVKTRKRNASVGMWHVRFITVSERKFFGSEQVDELDWPVWMATPEKALLDSFDRPDLAAPPAVVANALQRAWREDLIDPAKLVSDALKFESPVLNRRVGFFMELYEIPGWEPLSLMTGRRAVVPLAPGRETKGRGPAVINRRWRVYEDPSIVGAALDLK